jgi:hypothetical protein
MLDFMKKEILKERYNITNSELLEKVRGNIDDCVFLAGSIIESQNMPYSDGMGNKLSDIDVFLLTDDLTRFKDSAYDYSDYRMDFVQLKDVKLDIEIYKKSFMIGGLKQLVDLKFEQGVRALNLIKVSKHISIQRFLSFVHRMLTGSIIAGKELESFKNNGILRGNYFRILSRLAIGDMEGNYDDAIGNLDRNNLGVALFVARGILIDTVKLYLYSHKISLDRDKWVLLKLENLAKENEEAKAFYDKVFRFYYSSVVEQKDLKNNIESILDFSNNTIRNYSKKYGY